MRKPTLSEELLEFKAANLYYRFPGIDLDFRNLSKNKKQIFSTNLHCINNCCTEQH